MADLSNHEQAVELLQQLGLKEYEAKSFVALSRLPSGTARDISDISEVPRTRVYDAVRVLESKGLVEVQHSNPQRFRAVAIEEATETLRNEYESRAASLLQTLQDIEPVPVDDGEVSYEVWALSGEQAIAGRTRQLIDDADREVILVIGRESVFTEELTDCLEAAQQRGVSLIVGTIADGLRDRVESSLRDAEVFVSGLEWLSGSDLPGDETQISRLLLVDRGSILVSTLKTTPGDGQEREHAVFGLGFDNGIVAIARRLLATGLLPVDDPGFDDR